MLIARAYSFQHEKPGCLGRVLDFQRMLSPLVRGAVYKCVNEGDLRTTASLILVDQYLCFCSRILAQNALLCAPSVKNRLEHIEVFWWYCDIRFLHHFPPKD